MVLVLISSLTAELKDFFGYVKCLRIYSIICIISMIFAFPALIFVWYPIIGMNVSKKWNSSSFGCVLFDSLYLMYSTGAGLLPV